MKNRYTLDMNQTGVLLRINNDKAISYSWHNFQTPQGVDVMDHQRKRWARFLSLCMKFMPNLKLIKNGKLIFQRGES